MTMSETDLQQQLQNGADASLVSGLAAVLGSQLLSKGLKITTAESCTGGLIAGALTEVSGSSGWFEQGLVTYSNEAKQQLLNVPETVFKSHGAVSEACVLAMAEGALASAKADLAVSVSGIAGPDGGSTEKPVGTVWLAWATRCGAQARLFQFSGEREEIRYQAVVRALHGSIELLSG